MSKAVGTRHSTVSFIEDPEDNAECQCNEEREQVLEKKRNLTMKYGQKQRQIVQKRVRVENWLDGELQKLYDIKDPDETYPCDPDLDELMEIKSERERRESIMKLLKSCKQTDTVIQTFIDELMERMKTLE